MCGVKRKKRNSFVISLLITLFDTAVKLAGMYRSLSIGYLSIWHKEIKRRSLQQLTAYSFSSKSYRDIVMVSLRNLTA